MKQLKKHVKNVKRFLGVNLCSLTLKTFKIGTFRVSRGYKENESIIPESKHLNQPPPKVVKVNKLKQHHKDVKKVLGQNL